VVAAVLHEAARVRRDAGLDTLVVHAELARAARDHAVELARRGELDHASLDPDRRTIAQRIRLAGVRSYRRIGENLAAVLNPLIEPGRQVMRLWLESPGHRTNLLDPSFDRTGVGAIRAADGTWYVVQVYGGGIDGRTSASFNQLLRATAR
jgi:uncharacterized protein YkwD